MSKLVLDYIDDEGFPIRRQECCQGRPLLIDSNPIKDDWGGEFEDGEFMDAVKVYEQHLREQRRRLRSMIRRYCLR